MLQSRLFTKTRKDAPKDEVSKNAELLIRGGYLNKERAGIYNFLPLGLMVLNKIIGIIREEMNVIGGQEVSMGALQRSELWKNHFTESRWEDDVWFKTKFNDGTETGLAFTHEEPISNMMEQFVSSYKDLPFSVYQFQTKFRNEKRATSGVLRTREFIMKDLYSFSRNREEHLEFYEKAKEAYKRVFDRVGLGDVTYLTFASGGSFAKYSHEFQVVTSAGEDTIYINNDDYGKGLKMDPNHAAINKEVYNEDTKKDLNLSGSFKEEKAVEVGNIFTLGTRFSDPHLTFKNEKGEEELVYMGSYGIGPARLMGTVVETLSDEKGIVWPKSIAPFRAHLVLVSEDAKIKGLANELYKTLEANGVETLYDDREARAGEKFADSDLIGIPSRIVIGNKTAESGLYELKDRESGEVREVSLEHLLKELQK